MRKTSANPAGVPIEAFDKIREGVYADRSQFFRISLQRSTVQPGGIEGLTGLARLILAPGGYNAVIDCIKVFSETDFTEDLKKFDEPTLILHRNDDQIVPIEASALLSSKIVRGATLKVISGAPHGMCCTHKDQINAKLLEFSTAQPPSIGVIPDSSTSRALCCENNRRCSLPTLTSAHTP
jgi:non-heme chloroperoxidase